MADPELKTCKTCGYFERINLNSGLCNNKKNLPSRKGGFYDYRNAEPVSPKIMVMHWYNCPGFKKSKE
ncbi:MAG: hypothetical protein ACOCZW_02330 [Bacteroidota bacterium]